MIRDRQRHPITDDDIREILLTAESAADISQRLDVSRGSVDKVRRLESMRAIRIARELGVIKRVAPCRAWSPGGGTVVLAKPGRIA